MTNPQEERRTLGLLYIYFVAQQSVVDGIEAKTTNLALEILAELVMKEAEQAPAKLLKKLLKKIFHN